MRGFAAALLRRLLAPSGAELLGPGQASLRRAFDAALEEWAVADLDPDPGATPGATGIVFSRDRAMQLHALLAGWTENVSGCAGLRILWTASDAAHEASYRVLEGIWRGKAEFVRESSFRDDLLREVRAAPSTHLFFLTDDAVVLRPFRLDPCLLRRPSREILSLTHDRTLDWCFAAGRAQAIPPLSDRADGLLEWTWADGEPGTDWSYPLSVDGKFFSGRELALLLPHIPFCNPNTLEAAMQVFQPLFARRKGVCLPRAPLVNVPCNRVQEEFSNRTTGGWKTGELLERWNRGERIRHEEFVGLSPREAEERAFSFRPR